MIEVRKPHVYIRAILILLACSNLCLAQGVTKRAPQQIPLEQFLGGQVEVVGRLDRPLGKVARAEIQFVLEVEPPGVITKAGPQVLAELRSIDGVRLAKPVTFTRWVASTQIDAEAVKAGQAGTFIVYETIQYFGIPEGVYEGESPVQIPDKFGPYSVLTDARRLP